MQEKPEDSWPSVPTSEPVAEKPGLKLHVPVPVIRWLFYSIWAAGMLTGFLTIINTWQWVGLSFILGQLFSQLNAIIKKP